LNRYIPGGELYKAISHWGHFSESDAAYIMKQLLSAMNYCHSKNIVHRDLKPENILVDSIVDSKRNVKVINFENALRYSRRKKVYELVGTPNYMAPETIEGKCSPKSDVWSLGVIMYVMLSGRYPFDGNTQEEILEAIKEGAFGFEGIYSA
jgi:calcium-dependent protein kinase